MVVWFCFFIQDDPIVFRKATIELDFKEPGFWPEMYELIAEGEAAVADASINVVGKDHTFWKSPETLDILRTSFITQMDHPLKPKLDTIALRMLQAGFVVHSEEKHKFLISKTQRDYIRSGGGENEAVARPMTLDNFMGPFILYGLGVVLALVAFTCEGLGPTFNL